jgi:hypothetical protein
MRFWEQAFQYLRFDSRIFFGLLLGIFLVGSSPSLADVVHFHDGKTLRGRLGNVTGDILEFKPSFFRTQQFQRLTLSNRNDVIEMRNQKKLFGQIVYADDYTVEIDTSSGRTKINRFLIRNIVVGAPTQPPVDIPTQAETSNQTMLAPGTGVNLNETPTRVPLQSSTFMFPPPNTPSEDKDSINTDDRLP